MKLANLESRTQHQSSQQYALQIEDATPYSQDFSEPSSAAISEASSNISQSSSSVLRKSVLDIINQGGHIGC
jgi:hypothetical protein